MRKLVILAAMAMMFTGKPIDADEAFRIGLVNEVTAPDQLLERAQEWAVEITKSAPLGVQSIKEVAFKGQGMSIEEAMLQNYESIERVREFRLVFPRNYGHFWRARIHFWSKTIQHGNGSNFVAIGPILIIFELDERSDFSPELMMIRLLLQ